MRNLLGLVEPDRRFREGIVVGVADTADGRADADLDQPRRESAGQAGVDPATARAVAATDGVTVFQMGGGKQSCMLRSDAGGWGAGCTTIERVASDKGRQLLAERVESGGYRLYGLVGAGASKASVVTADGATAPAAISGAGAIVVTTRSRPTAVTISSGSEQTRSRSQRRRAPRIADRKRPAVTTPAAFAL